MKVLFIGSSSFIASLLKKKIKNNIFSITSSNQKSKNTFNIKFYDEKNILKALYYFKKKNILFDNVIHFNGFHKMSLLSFFNEKLFNEIIKKNFTTPMKVNSLIIKNHLLRKNCSIILISSIAAELSEIGNAYYSLAKTLLNKSINILSNEQKNKYRFNAVSLGLVKNKLSDELIKNLPSNYKNKTNFVKNEIIIKKLENLLNNKKINNKIIKIHGNYKTK
jgi:NADP-dependent 3-hydroxy acid dehydrogenase YdfG